jgi:hypothetical protein
MSEQYPECPLYNHNACREAYIPRICALVREDKECLKEKHRKRTVEKE